MTAGKCKLLIVGFVAVTLLGAYRSAQGADHKERMNVLFWSRMT